MKRLVLVLTLLATAPLALAQTPFFSCQGIDGEVEYAASRSPGKACEITGVSHDQRWLHVTSGANGDLVRIDSETIGRGNDTAVAWVQYVHLKQGRHVQGKGYVFKTLQREQFFCDGMTAAVVSTVLYSEENNVLGSWSAITPSFQPVVPDSMQEAVWKFLCK